MTPALREDLTGLRSLLSTAVARIDEALAIPGAAAQGRTPAAIVLVLASAGRPMTPREVYDALTCAGREVSEDAVYQACKRLADAGKIERCGRGLYAVKAAEGGA